MFDQKKIKTLLDKINWLANSFQENDFSNVSALEKSLLKEKVLMFYDEIQNIPTSLIKERIVTEIKNEVEQKTSPVFEKQEPVQELNTETKNVAIFKELEPKKIVAEEVKKVEPRFEIIEEQAKPTEKTVDIVAPVQKNEEEFKPTQRFEEQKPVEKNIAAKPPEISKEERFQNTEAFQKQVAKPKRDMREIIDLNKSFILKAELFSQNNDSYNQFLNEINLTRTEEEAQTRLATWTRRLKWTTEENKAYDLLARAVEKRFLPLI